MKYILSVLFLLFSCSTPPEEILGCTDSSACNYDENATQNDGSCLFFDCNGECGGDATIDNCGVCDSDPTNDNECTLDCDNCWNGDAFIDDCGECVNPMNDNGLIPNCILDIGGTPIGSLECDTFKSKVTNPGVSNFNPFNVL